MAGSELWQARSMIDEQVGSALAPLPAAYHEHFHRLVAAVEPDERIRGLWLSGSVARGTADGGSDLDLLLAVADEHFEHFIDHWRDWLDSIMPTLIAREIPRTKLIMHALTDDICRIDGVIEPVSELHKSPHRTRLMVIDRDNLGARVPTAEPGPGPSPERIELIIEEFWRIQSIFPAMLDGRRDLLCAQSGVQLGAKLLYDLFVECNRPLPPMGVKQFSARLTASQLSVLEALPGAPTNRSELVEANHAVCRAMATAGKAAASHAGASYPEVLAATVEAHHRANL